MATTELFQKKLVGPGGVASVQVYPVTSVTAGTPTYATVVDYSTFWTEVTLEGETTHSNLAGSGVIGAGNQPVLDDYTLTLAGHVLDLTGVTSAVPAPLLAAIAGHDYFKVVITAGGMTTTCWVTRGSPRLALTRESGIEQIQFKRADVGNTQTNPLFASTV